MLFFFIFITNMQGSNAALKDQKTNEVMSLIKKKKNSNQKLTLTLSIPLLQLANEVSLIVSVITSPMVITENLA